MDCSNSLDMLAVPAGHDLPDKRDDCLADGLQQERVQRNLLVILCKPVTEPAVDPDRFMMLPARSKFPQSGRCVRKRQ